MTEPEHPGDRVALAATLAGMAAEVSGCASTRLAGERIVHTAAEVVGCTAMVGLTLFTHTGQLRTRAYTDAQVLLLDHLQSRYQEGPGLAVASARGREVVTIEDMARDRRWPRFATAALRLGVQSMIVCGLPMPGGGTAALNLHAFRPAAFDAAAIERAALFAAYSSVAYSQARLAENVATALTSRQAIGEATGMLMERHRIDSAEATERLARNAQRLDAHVWRVAEAVVRTGVEPIDLAPGDLTAP